MDTSEAKLGRYSLFFDVFQYLAQFEGSCSE